MSLEDIPEEILAELRYQEENFNAIPLTTQKIEKLGRICLSSC